MNKAALKRMTRRTEFYMFLVLIVLIALVGVISKGSCRHRLHQRQRKRSE